MGKLFKAMALLCLKYDAESRNLVKKHELSIEEDRTVKENFVMAYPRHNVKKAWPNVHAAYDLFQLNQIKNKVKVLEDFMTKGADGHVFCPIMQVAL